MNAKTVNYTPEATATAVADYKAGVTVAEIATKLGKSTRSVVAKLSREGVYEKKAYVGKTGEKAVTKAALVAEIADKMGVPAEDFDSLEAANKEVLKALAAAL